MNFLHLILLIIILHQSASLIVERKSFGKVDKVARNVTKKSVETLYSIENENGAKPTGYYYPHPSVYEPEAQKEDPHSNHPSQLQLQEHALHSLLASNPLLAALFLSQNLGIPAAPAKIGFNSLQHLPVNPYVALFLSHYGRYIHPVFPGSNRHQRGIYGYTAANNYHNNKPFGSYKIYEDARK